MFTNDAHYLAIGIALLVNKVSKHKNIIVCNDNIIPFSPTDSLIEKKNKLLKYSGPCKPINVNNYKQLIRTKDKYSLLFITKQHIQFNKTETTLQFIPYYDNNYEVLCFSNGTLKKNLKMEEDELTSDRIKLIVKTSDELNDRQSPPICIMIMFFLWAMVQIYGYMFIYK